MFVNFHEAMERIAGTRVFQSHYAQMLHDVETALETEESASEAMALERTDEGDLVFTLLGRQVVTALDVVRCNTPDGVELLGRVRFILLDSPLLDRPASVVLSLIMHTDGTAGFNAAEHEISVVPNKSGTPLSGARTLLKQLLTAIVDHLDSVPAKA